MQVSCIINNHTFNVTASSTSNTFGVYAVPYTLDSNIVVIGSAFNVGSSVANTSYGIYNYYSETSGLKITGNTFNNINDPVYIYGYPPYVNNNISVTVY